MARSAGARFIEPMKCQPVTELPIGKEWWFETKLDGYRCIAVKRGTEVELFSRTRNSLNDRFPGVVESLARVAEDFVLDGEMVALNAEGKPSFQLLQNTRSGKLPVTYYAFDLLYRDGESFLDQPLEARREQLEAMLKKLPDRVRLSPIFPTSAAKVLKEVRRLGLEGVVGKRRDSVYEPDARSGAWIKHRTDQQQEFVIGGYVPGPHGFDRLLIGLYENGEFRYVAKLKNGFVPELRREIFPAIKKLETKECPFVNLPQEGRRRWGEPMTAEKMKECKWVRPKLVCQVAFVEWTEAANLRHCRFIAMRDDKNPSEVVRET